MRVRWGSRSAPAAVAFAVLAPAAVLSGQLPFLLGIALALGALWALQGRRVALALVLLLLTDLASPLAFAFALVPLIAVAATTPGWWRRRRLLAAAAGVCAIVALAWLQQRAFARAGTRYPANLSEAITIALWCAAGLALAWRVAGQRLMLAVFAVYAALGAVALAVPSPLGGNWVRLAVFMGVPLLLVPMAARRFRPLALVLPVLAIALASQTAYVVGVARESAASRSSEEAFWRPVQGFLASHATPDYRVEAVATTGHWEAYYLPRHGIPIARGWFRQDDWPQNAALYDEPLTPGVLPPLAPRPRGALRRPPRRPPRRERPRGGAADPQAVGRPRGRPPAAGGPSTSCPMRPPSRRRPGGSASRTSTRTR